MNRRLPGPGTTILAHDLAFSGRIALGDTLTATVTAREKRSQGNVIVFDCQCTNAAGAVIAAGSATVAAPTRSIAYTDTDIATPEVIFRRSDLLGRLIKACAGLPPVVCAVVHPCDQDSLLGPLEAAKRGLITPVLIGPKGRIRAAAEAAGADLSPYTLVDAEDGRAAAQQAVALARAGEVQALMKGSLHTDELMGAVVPSATGLRTARRISHAFVMDVPTYPRLLLVTDAAINVAPGLKEKADIVQNAIDLFLYRIRREMGSLAAALGGLDAIVFTGGIGEHAAPIRAGVCRDSAWLGVELDADANARGGPRISTSGSRVQAWVIPTNEELMIARHTWRLVG